MWFMPDGAPAHFCDCSAKTTSVLHIPGHKPILVGENHDSSSCREDDEPGEVVTPKYLAFQWSIAIDLMPTPDLEFITVSMTVTELLTPPGVPSGHGKTRDWRVMSSSLVPLKIRHVGRVVHVKYVERPPVGAMWNLGDGGAGSGVVVVTWPWFKITRSVTKSYRVAE
ncbi:hypothetical protein TNCV_45951 [Trichonephila clavipes]|nr:hypothetical protein TNCV_45951 [Trichonephila clavipes]